MGGWRPLASQQSTARAVSPAWHGAGASPRCRLRSAEKQCIQRGMELFGLSDGRSFGMISGSISGSISVHPFFVISCFHSTRIALLESFVKSIFISGLKCNEVTIFWKKWKMVNLNVCFFSIYSIFLNLVSTNNSGRPRRRNYWKLYIMHFAFKSFKLIKVSIQLLAGPADLKQMARKSQISTRKSNEDDGNCLKLEPNSGSILDHFR